MTTATKTEKTDLYRDRPAFFRAPRKPELIDLPEATFLVVDGEGAPDGRGFQDAIGALYSIGYTVKMTAKKDGGDFKVPTFEGAWWFRSDAGDELPRDNWRWQLLMMMPDFVTAEDVEQAKRDLAARKKALAAEVSLQRVRHGLCVQMLHVGPYATENESIDRMRAFMEENGVKPLGPHHEVYLGNPQRSKPEALKTILRQQVERV